MTDRLTTVEIDPKSPPRAAVIWMHGLGADAHDFEPIVPHLGLEGLGVRFVFPNAPRQPVTINGGMVMPAWYDVLSMDIPRREDAAGLRASEAALRQLIEAEVARGIPPEAIVLAGFSQGGVMALQTGLRHPEALGGILALSCYLPLKDHVAAERHPANQNIPIFFAHGRFDPVIPMAYGKASVERLEALGYAVEWREYPMEHAVSPEEIQDIGQWFRRVLAEPQVP